MSQKPSSDRRTEVLIVVVTTFVGALVCVLLTTWYFNRDNRWFRISSPPNETPVEIVALDRLLNLYVRTKEGNLYVCGSSWRDACRAVSPEEVPTPKVPAQWRTCSSFPTNLPAAPGIVIESLAVGRCLEATTYSQHAILSDGSIWQWRRTFSWANRFAQATCITMGIAVGLVAGIIVVKVRRSLRRT